MGLRKEGTRLSEMPAARSAPRVEPRTAFEWGIYSDATFAGLAVLIPIPLVDWVFEEIFRRRMPAAIARRRGQRLAPGVIARLNMGTNSCLASCLILPVRLVVELVMRTSRKILYFLTIKEASDKVSYYWHRAFLLDYMLLAGDLQSVESVSIARLALELVLRNATTSPLIHLARQVTGGTRHVFRTLFRARRGGEDEAIRQKKAVMRRRWSDFEDYFLALAAQYDLVYQDLLARLTTVETPGA
jgi:hypothetical protein